MDLFTQRRIFRFIEEYRVKSGQLPTHQDLESAGFAREQIKEALKEKIIEEFYVTLTNGTIMKGYKITQK